MKFLPKQEKFDHKGKVVTLGVLVYFSIGYLLMRWGVIFKNRHGQQLISWPVALIRRILGYKSRH